MTDELYNYIILLIVVLAQLHLWFHKFKYQKYEKQFCKVHHIDELQRNIRKSGYISQIKTSKEALLGLVDEINKYKELDKKETEKEFEKLIKTKLKDRFNEDYKKKVEELYNNAFYN